MVLCQLHGLVLADHIDPAVADMGDKGALAQQQESRQGGAHAPLLGFLLSTFEDGHTSLLRGVFQGRKDVLRCDALLVACVRVQQVLACFHRVAKIGHRYLRGNLARGMAAHTVSDREERQLLVNEEVVLVVLSLPTNVGRGPETQLHDLSCTVTASSGSCLNSIYRGGQQELARQDGWLADGLDTRSATATTFLPAVGSLGVEHSGIV